MHPTLQSSVLGFQLQLIPSSVDPAEENLQQPEGTQWMSGIVLRRVNDILVGSDDSVVWSLEAELVVQRFE